MSMLIERLKERAHDPQRATDEGNDVTSGGKPVVFVAAPPATEQELVDAESRLGFRLPAVLREIYLEVGDGGFGPGYGLFGVTTDDEEESLIARYEELRAERKSFRWPVGLIPICDWGHGIESYVDCTLPDAPVIRVDANMPKDDVIARVPVGMHYVRASHVEDACWIENPSLQTWLEAWIEDKQLFYLGYTGPDEEDEEEFDEDEE